MAVVQTLISAVGPLPLSATFNAEGDGDVVFYISGSAWSQTEGSPLGFTLILDSTAIGTSTGFTNESASHKALVPIFIPATLTEGSHTIELQAETSETTTDLNDNFQVTLIY
ncbi:hypothetical protein BH10ACI1_BH10ACI1_08110 [soil metagenome]